MDRLPVEVRNTYNGAWSPGFEIAETTSHGVRLRRLSDDTVLPGEFPIEDVRGLDQG
jgi:hypothetical protein